MSILVKMIFSEKDATHFSKTGLISLHGPHQLEIGQQAVLLCIKVNKMGSA